MTTRKLNSKNINVDSEVYIGKDGEIWVDTDTNLLKISDGATPGGVVITTDGAGLANVAWADITDISNISGPTSVVIGQNAGGAGLATVAIGVQAGQTTQGSEAVAIGQYAGLNTQGIKAVAVGTSAGTTNQGSSAVAIGNSAAYGGQGDSAVAVGSDAGKNTQGLAAVAVGNNTGAIYQGASSVAIGSSAGVNRQDTKAVSIGINAGENRQGSQSIAIGDYAARGETETVTYTSGGNNGTNLVVVTTVGLAVGMYVQDDAYGLDSDVSITTIIDAQTLTMSADWTSPPGATLTFITGQTPRSVAIGASAGRVLQGTQSVAIGKEAGKTTQSEKSVAIGPFAGMETQGDRAVAIGHNAGKDNQGDKAVAIGTNAGATNQAANSIVINATGLAVENVQPDSFVVKPIRNLSGTHSMEYNPTTGEITYDTLAGGETTIMATVQIAGGNAGFVLAPLDTTVAVQILDSSAAANNGYSLANGVEGQIMYFVPGNSATNTVIGISVGSVRRLSEDGTQFIVATNNTWQPFIEYDNLDASAARQRTLATAVFAAGAWNLDSPWFVPTP